MAIAFVGIIAVQVYWFKMAIHVREEQYDRAVSEALESLNKELSSKRKVDFYAKHITGIEVDSLGNFFTVTDINEILEEIKIESFFKGEDNAESVAYTTTITGGDKSVLVTGDSKNSYSIRVSDSLFNNPLVFFDQSKDSATVVVKRKSEDVDVIHVDKVLGQIVLEATDYKNEFEWLSQNEFERISKEIFHQKGIDTTFEYAIKRVVHKRFAQGNVSAKYEFEITFESEEFEEESSQKVYESAIKFDNFLTSDYALEIYFPNRQIFLFRSVAWLAFGSLFFSICVLAIFTSTVFTIIKQKKLSVMKSDFINNMTHEFKTPIATISLAADSIVNAKIIDKPDRIQSFINIIKEENKRMNLQVEHVLQMAMLDKEELQFNLEEIHINEVLKEVMESVRIRVESAGGQLVENYSSISQAILMDKNHFTNILHNLIDNAIKYSPNELHVEVKSSCNSEGAFISVSDRGIGMSKEEQKHIFERFYRVSSGNIHNVKGFGLGLSYVKAIVDQFAGKVSVESEKTKGSKFQIFIPFKRS
jgi:two-component system phosphate regulon sensor histidine kinase PhoR